MTETDQHNNLSAELVSEIRKEAISQVAKYAVMAFGALIVIAATGWWFYLKQQVDEYIIIRAGGVPASAVIAFDAPNECPDGWTEFKEAAGNVVIGISDKHPYRNSGGFEAHQLKVAELPPYQISFTVNEAASSGAGDRYNAGGKDYLVITKSPKPLSIEVGGKGDSISTMPPYVTLRYCKKNTNK
jgi:hypothetical protein